ncbi:MAG: zinc-ribbon domain-containing protein, partial [Gammaproteobacteria bacterium]|nr:zinc-ribbon domain-containing protein [Gammaproteobacteria bacterium]
MYTQCPECSVAFRVTAEVLRQAAGKVRCGGCGIAFNALDYLSEHRPQEPAHAAPEPQLPELAPDEPDEIELEADTPPQSISAEQSAALLKTLDQLAGSDIRIEDTGVEWRVLNDDEDDSYAFDGDEEAGIEVESTNLIADTGSLKFIIEDDKNVAPVDSIVDEPSEIIEEMRFDDDTPLPDDFVFESEPSADPEPVVEEQQEAAEP